MYSRVAKACTTGSLPALLCGSIGFVYYNGLAKQSHRQTQHLQLPTQCETRIQPSPGIGDEALRLHGLETIRSDTMATPAAAPVAPIPTPTESALGRFNFVADAAEKVLPSVVRVEVKAGPGGRLRGSGSGFVVDAGDVKPGSTGVYILTNAHCVLTPEEFHRNEVIEDGRQVFLEMKGSQQIRGWMVAFDVEKDVACIEPFDQGHLMASSLVDGRVRHGEFVLAVGAPLSLESSVTVGIVSNPDRNVGVHRYIQTDAAVHIGNSGGPLANIHGQIIGINSIKVAEGITYAIPIHEAIETIRKSMRNQTNGSASLSIPQP